ncbi:MAG: hypothetical protein ABI378_07855 [Chitinophagaceae bacterium]
MIKRFLPLVFLAFLLTSCEFYKVASITSDTTKEINNSVVFENDTIKVTYNFWALNGLMLFDIYNKINVPIYLDWKKSAFIVNDKMMSYWQDETNTVGVASSSAYYLYGGGVGGSSRSKSKSVREERVGVVPPHSYITSSKYSLVPQRTTLPVQTFNVVTSPLQFRNYLAVSTSEQFDKNVFYIDNGFFVSNVKKVRIGKIRSAQSSAAFYTN